MRPEIQELQAICDRFSTASTFTLSPGLSTAQVIAALQAHAQACSALKVDFARLLREHVDPMLQDHQLTDEDEDALFAVAQRFSAYAVRTDPGLGLKIYKALLARARSVGDRDRTIKYLYWCGITLFFSTAAYQSLTYAPFQEGAAYRAVYDEIESRETRQYIHRCMGNMIMGMRETSDTAEAAKRAEDENMAFWNSVIFSGKDADFPWNAYFLNCYVQRHRHTSAPLRTLNAPPPTREQLAENLHLSQVVNRLYYADKTSGAVFGGTRYDLCLWEAQLMAGLISFNQFQDNIEKRQAMVAPGDYSADALYCKVQLNTYLMFYAKRVMPDNARRQRLIESLSQTIFDYCVGIPADVNPSQVGSALALFAGNASAVVPVREHLALVLRLTTFRHLPTCAHSLMVSRIATLVMRTLLAHNPEVLIGLDGTDTVEAVAQRREAFLEMAELAGLCHDVGKINYVWMVSLNAHPLNEEEEKLVQEHTTSGRALVERMDFDTERPPYPDVVEGHHRHYDGVGGYPDTFDLQASPHKALIHIVTFANALDNMTDPVAWCGNMPLEAACDAIRARSGSTFAQHLAALLDDPKFLSRLTALLETARPEAYDQAYRTTTAQPQANEGRDE